eukprot:g24401.t1
MVHTHAYDCDEGSEDWQHTWSTQHARYCCYLRQIGCKTKVEYRPHYHTITKTKPVTVKVPKYVHQKHYVPVPEPSPPQYHSVPVPVKGQKLLPRVCATGVSLWLGTLLIACYWVHLRRSLWWLVEIGWRKESSELIARLRGLYYVHTGDLRYASVASPLPKVQEPEAAVGP